MTRRPELSLDRVLATLRTTLDQTDAAPLATNQHVNDLVAEFVERLCPCTPGAPPHEHLTGGYSFGAYLDFFCPEHGGTTTPELCDDESHPQEPLPECTCPPSTGYRLEHLEGCPRRVGPIRLPAFRASRGGIRYGQFDEPSDGPPF